MPTRLEERLRRYGETLERVITADAYYRPTEPRRVPWRRRRLVAVLSAAAVVLGTAALIAVIIRSGDDDSGVASRPPARAIPSLGVERLWPGPETQDVDRSGPEATAASFAHDLLGETPARLTADAAAAPGDPTWVEVDLANGASFRVLTVPTPDGWVVLQAGDRLFTYSAEFGAVIIEPAGAAVARVDLSWRDTAGSHTKSVPGSEAVGGRIPITVEGTLLSAVVVLRDTSGAPTDVVGGSFGGPGEPDDQLVPAEVAEELVRDFLDTLATGDGSERPATSNPQDPTHSNSAPTSLTTTKAPRWDP